MFRFALGIAAAGLLAGCVSTPQDGGYRSDWSRYDYDRPDPAYGNYNADRYHRDDPRRYRERRMSSQERIYRGQDGRYYCRRSDGTTGLIVGAVAGGVLGNVIAPGGSEVVGTILGALGGGVAGRAIDRNREVRCR
ncbi:MAG: glycine zipper 2TM domain-containing protein [Porphyrobacter sp. IPPAS B-1204]|nr:MAG: glycine zipper 2TM domain-containing protein [Porphyrobacter sp. IPPAS B-1204]